jgi:group I intron endonuclease
MYIYKIVNLKTGKIYIGKCKDSLKKSAHYLGSGLIIKHAVNRYGKANFKKIILERCSSLRELDSREIYWIQRYDATNKNTGYNIAAGGEGGDILTHHPRRAEILEKMRRSHGTKEAREKSRQQHLGISWGKHTLKTRRLLSRLNKGKKFSKEHKHNLSIARRQRITTEETKERMRRAMTGKQNIKKYLVVSPNGKKYLTNRGLTDFCRKRQLQVANLLNTFYGKRNSHKGWKVLACFGKISRRPIKKEVFI